MPRSAVPFGVNDPEEEDWNQSNALPLEAENRASTRMDSPEHQLPAADYTPAPTETPDLGASPFASALSGFEPQGSVQDVQDVQLEAPRLKGIENPDLGTAIQNFEQPTQQMAPPRAGYEDQWIREQDRLNREGTAQKAGASRYLRAQGVEMETLPDGSQVIASHEDGAPRFKSANSTPFQDEQGQWRVRSRSDRGELSDLNLLDTKGIVHVDPKTGDQYFMGADKQPVMLGSKDQRTVDALDMRAKRAEFEGKIATRSALLGELQNGLSQSLRLYGGLLSGGAEDGSTRTVRQLQNAVDNVRPMIEAGTAEPDQVDKFKEDSAALDKYKLAHPEYQQTGDAITATRQKMAQMQHASHQDSVRRRLVGASPDVSAAVASLLPSGFLDDAERPAGDASLASVDEDTAATAATGRTSQSKALPAVLEKLKAGGMTTIGGKPIDEVIAAAKNPPPLPEPEAAPEPQPEKPGWFSNFVGSALSRIKTGALSVEESAMRGGLGGASINPAMAVAHALLPDSLRQKIDAGADELAKWRQQLQGVETGQVKAEDADVPSALKTGAGLLNPERKDSWEAGLGHILPDLALMFGMPEAAIPVFVSRGMAEGQVHAREESGSETMGALKEGAKTGATLALFAGAGKLASKILPNIAEPSIRFLTQTGIATSLNAAVDVTVNSLFGGKAIPQTPAEWVERGLFALGFGALHGWHEAKLPDRLNLAMNQLRLSAEAKAAGADAGTNALTDAQSEELTKFLGQHQKLVEKLVKLQKPPEEPPADQTGQGGTPTPTNPKPPKPPLSYNEKVTDDELGTRVIQAKDGEKVLGYIAFGNNLNGYGTINMVWVSPDARGQGLSTDLYKRALQSAKANGLNGLASIDENLHSPEKTKSTRKHFDVRESTDKADLRRALDLSGKAVDKVVFLESEKGSQAKDFEQTLADSQPLRDRIQELREFGGPEGLIEKKQVEDALNANQQALTAHAQAATNEVPPEIRERIAQTVSPNLTESIRDSHFQLQPEAAFMAAEVGRRARGAYLDEGQQRAIAEARTAAGERGHAADFVADQQVGLAVGHDLANVLTGGPIGESRARALVELGLLHAPEDGGPVQVTDDALKLIPPSLRADPRIAPRFKLTPGSPQDGAALLVRGGQDYLAEVLRQRKAAAKPAAKPKAQKVKVAFTDKSVQEREAIIPATGNEEQAKATAESRIEKSGNKVLGSEVVDEEGGRITEHFATKQEADAFLAENQDRIFNTTVTERSGKPVEVSYRLREEPKAAKVPKKIEATSRSEEVKPTPSGSKNEDVGIIEQSRRDHQLREKLKNLTSWTSLQAWADAMREFGYSESEIAQRLSDAGHPRNSIDRDATHENPPIPKNEPAKGQSLTWDDATLAEFTPDGQAAIKAVEKEFQRNAALFRALGVKGFQPSKFHQETGGVAMGADGVLRADGAQLAEHFATLSREGVKPGEWAKRALQEEAVHLAQFKAAGPDWKAYYEKVWADVPAEMRAEAAKAYQNFDGLGDAEKAAEVVRMVIQGRWKGSITESIRDAIKQVVDYLRGFDLAKAPLVKEAVERAEAVLDKAFDDVAAARKKPSKTAKPEGAEPSAWKLLGKNSDGNEVFEDQRGVRSYTEGDFRFSQPVGIIPGGGISVDEPTGPYKVTEAKAASEKPPASKAEELAAKLFDGLAASAPSKQEQIGFPADRRAIKDELARTLLDENIRTPEALAKFISEKIGERGQKYSQALWNALSSEDPSLTGAHDWQRIYAGEPAEAAAPADAGQQIVAALRKLHQESRYRDAQISDVQRESGVPLPELHAWIRAASRAGDITPTINDWSLASPDARAANIEIAGQPHLAIGLTEQGEKKYSKAPAEEPSAPMDKAVKFAATVKDKLLAGEKVSRADFAKLGSEGMSAKQADEAAELGIVLAGRKIVSDGGTPEEVFARALDTFERQPNLTAKTSTSKVNQAYSTPLPLAVLANHLARVGKNDVVMDSAAGNGMLLIGTDPAKAIVNELNEARAAQLRAQGFKVTVGDATEFTPAEKPDRIILNPPFGTVMEEGGERRDWPLAGTNETTREIDHAIAMRALQSIADDGRAVLILGGTQAEAPEARAEHYAARQKFFGPLYEQYRVVDHFTVDGDLYRKQGAGWPVDMLVIAGKGRSPIELPSARPPRILRSWNELRHEISRSDAERIKSGRYDAARDRERLGDQLAGVRAAAQGTEPAGRLAGKSENLREPSREPGGTGERAGADLREISAPDAPARDAAIPGATRERPGSVDVGQDAGGAESGRGLSVEESQRSFHAPYKPRATGPSFEVETPVNMEEPQAEALRRTEEAVGKPLAEFVREKLGYAADADLGKHFAAEQLDALAQAVHQIETGGAMVLGDQTGVGKGRVVAGLIEYAKKSGKTPIFVTNDPKLYSAMLGDLRDIGRSTTPLFTNNDIEFTHPVTGEKVKQTPRATKALVEEMTNSGKLPEGYDALFTTYDQIGKDYDQNESAESRKLAVANEKLPADGPRTKALRSLARNAIFILDESHKAAGASTQGRRVISMIGDAPVYYSSATFAKRPDSMPLYFRTNLSRAVGSGSMKEIFRPGDVVMQQVASAMLARDGQYMRRERTYDGVPFATNIIRETETRDKGLADAYTGGLRVLMGVSNRLKDATKRMNQIMARAGKKLDIPAMKLESADFASGVHNFVSQYLLAIKAESVANRAIRAIQEGQPHPSPQDAVKKFKVVVALVNTMESPIQDMSDAGRDLNFSSLLARQVDKLRTISSGSGRNKTSIFVSREPSPEFANASDSELERQLVEVKRLPDGTEYATANEKVGAELFRRIINEQLLAAEDELRGIDLGDMPLSPIDHIRQRLAAAGIKSGEISGRSIGIGEDGALYQRDPKEFSKAGQLDQLNEFNNSDTDALIITASGSTGISAHAGANFARRDPRMMLVAQPDLDINEFMQKLGRIFRSGQVEKPAYEMLQTALPAELRPAAILGKKMASLNANTTSNTESQVSSGAGVSDLFNEYGDQVVWDYLARNPDFTNDLQWGKLHELDKAGSKTLKTLQAMRDQFGEDGKLARGVSSYAAILPWEAQEGFWDKVTSDYDALIGYLDSIGENGLKAAAEDLGAETLSRKPFTGGNPTGTSEFDKPSFIEEVKVRPKVTPMAAEEAETRATAAGQGKRRAQNDYRSASNAAIEAAVSKRRQKAVSFDEAKERARLTEQRDEVWGALDMLGERVKITGAKGAVAYGAVTGYELSAEGPLTPSKQHIIVATNSLRREIKIPASQAQTRLARVDPETWRDQYEATREDKATRQIVTGNLVAAAARLEGKGHVTIYTKSDGSSATGILLPADYKAAVAAQPVRDAAHASELLTAGRNLFGDGRNVQLSQKNGQTLLNVPASRQAGGKYWQNPALNRLLEGGEFRQVGNRMVGEVSDLPATLRWLEQQGLKLSFEAKDEEGGLAASRAGTSNLTASIEKNIADAKMMRPEDPAGFLREMVARARARGDEETAANLERAVASVGESAPADSTPAGKIASAYRDLAAESKFPSVRIADLAKRAGLPLEQVKEHLHQQWRAGKVQLEMGDWSVSSEETRKGAITVNGDKMLMARFTEPASPSREASSPSKPSEGGLAAAAPTRGAEEEIRRGGPVSAVIRAATPGLEIGRDVKQGIQSLLLPSAKGPENLAAAEVLGSKLGRMNQRAEGSNDLTAKDHRAFVKRGVDREGLPIDRNAGIKFMSDASTGREVAPEFRGYQEIRDRQYAARIGYMEAAGAPLQSVRENYFPGIWTGESRRAFNLAMDQAREQGIIEEGTGVNDATEEQMAWVKARVDAALKNGQGSDKDALGFLTKRPFKGKEGFRKQKVFDQDIATAFKFGLKAVSNNPVDIDRLKWAEMDRSIMANDALAEWAKEGKLKFLKMGEKVPDGWQKVDDRYGIVWGPREMDVTSRNSRLVDADGLPVSLEEAGLDALPPEGTRLKARLFGRLQIGNRIVPNPVGDVLNNYLSSSLYNNPYFGKLYKGWMGFANVLNQTQLGVGSAFHAGFTTMEAQISAGANLLKDAFGLVRGNRSLGQVLGSVKNLGTATGETAFTGDKVLNAWRDRGGTINPRIRQVVEAAELAGGGFTMERGLQTDQTSKMMADWYNGHELRAALRSPVAGLELLARPIMSWLVPRQKAGVFAHLAWRIIEQNPGVAMEDLRPQFRQAWNRVDARLGQVRYDRLFMNNTAKNVIQGLVRAPGWSGGTIAELGGAFKDTFGFFHEWQRTGKLPADVPDRVAYTASLLLTVGLANAALTYAFTGQQPEGLDYWAFRTGGEDEHGNPERFILPTYMKDILAYAKEPLTTLVNKAHPTLSLFGDLWRNKDYYGVEVRHEDDGAVKQALQSGKYIVKAFEPFWTRGLRRELERKASPERVALPWIGVMPAPKKMTQTPAERLADEYAKASLPAGGRTQAQADASHARYQLAEAIRRGEHPDFSAAIKAGYLKRDQIATLRANAKLTPLQAQVKRLSLDKADAVFKAASEKERAELGRIMREKRANASARR